MNVHNLDNTADYVRLLESSGLELETLFRELLIGVTSFFRDAEAFEVLADRAVPALLADKPDDYLLRVWVTGCSTGEEAYSIAILLRECTDRLKRHIGIQVFATDIDDSAIAVARAGVYPDGIAADVGAARLERFFVREDNGYRVKKDIRELVVFAPHNLIADPPFTKLDLLCCRNLLIYLDSPLQRRLLPIFHYALKPGGQLFLGSAESLGAAEALFQTLDKKWKIFSRRDVPSGTYVTDFPAYRQLGEGRSDDDLALVAPPVGRGGARAADRALLNNLVPPSVIVHERGEIVHIHGRTGSFLEPAPGPQTHANIFNMARDGLELDLASSMRQAALQSDEVVQRGVRVRTNGDTVTIDLRVKRLAEPGAMRGLFIVVFEPVNPAVDEEDEEEEDASEPSDEPPGRTRELERELQHVRENHQGTTEQLETANEELKSTNEELQSTNEELQSANEELETSKEEMQSLNEELHAVNAELQGKVDELSHANDDMKNLLNGSDIATVFLDDDLSIKRYTEQAKSVIRLIPSDVGRPLGDIVNRLRYDSLVEDAQEVLRTLVYKEVEVGGEGDTWYLMRILPYRTTDNVIDGLVLTFVDVTRLRLLEDREQRLSRTLRNSPTTVYGQDRELRFVWAYSALFGEDVEACTGKTDEEVFDVATELVALKTAALHSGTDQREQLTLTVGGRSSTYDVFVAAMKDASGAVVGVTSVMTDLIGPTS
jgi:two-component system CheB/CheR fusion protein